jgi:serine/threonine protein phosphatase PrpC
MIQDQLQQWLMRSTQQAKSFNMVDGLPIAMASNIASRSENQDRVLVLKTLSDKGMFIIGVLCDGMGGMLSGAECASSAIASFINSCIQKSHLDIKDRLWVAINTANNFIYDKHKGYSGTTLSAFGLDNKGNFEAVNIGDSRIYLVVDNKLNQISTDDTIEGALGKSTLSNYLLQHIGMADAEPHQIGLPAPSSISKIIMTSDGAHFIEHKTLESILIQDAEPTELAKRLISVSEWCGGSDNSSALILTDLKSLSCPTGNTPMELFQIWDTFGSVQLSKNEIY